MSCTPQVSGMKVTSSRSRAKVSSETARMAKYLEPAGSSTWYSCQSLLPLGVVYFASLVKVPVSMLSLVLSTSKVSG